MKRLTQGVGGTARLIVAVAVCALVVGATGAVAGQMITGKDIRNGSIKGKDLAKKVRKKLNKRASAGAPGQAGANGTNGTDGTDGTNGTNGTNGADGVDGGNGSKIGPVGFERNGFLVGNIDGQNGWIKSGPFDVAVVDTSTFPDASGYGFGGQALRLSNAVTSGSFGDQAFSPGLPDEAGEDDSYDAGFGSGDVQPRFDASFSIGTTQASEQTGLTMTVSPDQGTGSRVSYLRFEDQSDGVHVVFFDVQGSDNPANFVGTDIATLSRDEAHQVEISIDFVPGPGNDVVTITIDGNVVHTGTTWENYYRFDSEQAGNDNLVPTVDKLLFREAGANAAGTAGNGFLVDKVMLASSTPH